MQKFLWPFKAATRSVIWEFVIFQWFLFLCLLGKVHGEQSDQRTAFKSLGLAIEDFVAAKMTYDKIKTSSPWPVEFIEANTVEDMAKKVSNNSSVIRNVSNKVTNLSCEASLLEDQKVMVCELKTNSTCLALVYKAKTGELKAILDTSTIQNLPNEIRNGLFGKFV